MVRTSMVRSLFSPVGRIGRAEYCLGVLGLLAAFGFMLLMADAIDRTSNPSIRFVSQVAFFALMATAATGLLAMIPMGIKRLHDRGKSGLWLGIFYCVPALVVVCDPGGVINWSWQRIAALTAFLSWSFLELCCRPGTNDANPRPRD